MKNIWVIIIICNLGLSLKAQESHTILNSGSTFSPSLLEVAVGDQITFNVGSFHPVLQVSEATYNANGKTALAGGFSYTSGSGTFTANTVGTIYYVCTNHVASGMKGRIIVSGATDVQLQTHSSGFEIYPNPAIDFANIKNYENSNPLKVSVSDISGKTVLWKDEQFSSQEKSQIDISTLKKGIYFVSLTYPDKTLTRKLIKQ